MKRILLINQGKTENLGDKAIYETFKEILIDNECIVDFAGFAQTNEQSMTTMSINKSIKVRYYLKKVIPNSLIWLLKYKKKINKEFNDLNFKKYDLVIIGGGQLIKTKGVFLYTLYTWQKILRENLSCPVILAGVGADTQYSKVEKMIYKKILPRFASVYVRDEKSRKILKNKFQINAEYIPDIVFSYSHYFPIKENKKDNLLVMIFDYKTLKKHFGTNYSQEEYYKEWVKLIKQNLEPNIKITLGYTTIEDKIETIRFAEYLKHFVSINNEVEVINTDTLENLVMNLETTKKIISGRMHGMLLGINYGCEIVPFIVSPKIETFKNEWVAKKLNLSDIHSEIDRKVKGILEIHSN